MRTKFFAALLGCCTLTVATASDRQILATDLQDFPGQYDLVDGCLLNIMQRGHRLFMQLENQPEAEIVAIGAAAFVAKSGQVRLEFVQYPNGNVPTVRVIDTAAKGQRSCQRPARDLRNDSHLVPNTVSGPNGVSIENSIMPSRSDWTFAHALESPVLAAEAGQTLGFFVTTTANVNAVAMPIPMPSANPKVELCRATASAVPAPAPTPVPSNKGSIIFAPGLENHCDYNCGF